MAFLLLRHLQAVHLQLGCTPMKADRADQWPQKNTKSAKFIVALGARMHHEGDSPLLFLSLLTRQHAP
jgi:hypothetical protein